MVEFVICLLVVATLGYLSQTTGLCIVRGMREWMDGKLRFMAAILVSGIFAWGAGMLSGFLGSDSPYQRIACNGWFAEGGLLFGAGAAFNQGCSVSTLGRLSRGELGMITTILGWLIGWGVLIPQAIMLMSLLIRSSISFWVGGVKAARFSVLFLSF